MRGLIYQNISESYSIVLDPDNIFWAIINKSKSDCKDFFIPQALLSLYEKNKERLDNELNEFRFSAELTAVYIDPTDRCNANCPYCYIPKKIRMGGRSMKKEELTFILDKISEYFKHQKQKPVIVFHASEPLLVKDIVFEAIKEYKDRFNFGLQTNAVLLEREDVEFLKGHRVGVGISLDYFLPSINNRLRPTLQRSGNYYRAIQGLDWFDGYEGLNVITTVTKLNVLGLPQMIGFLHSKKVPCVLLNPVRLTQNSSYKLKPDEKLLTKFFIKAVDTAIELSRHSAHRILIGNFSNIILGIVAPTARRLMCDISPCGGGRCFLTITASGEMIPCGEFISLKGFSGGNIFKTSINKAMKSKPFRRLRMRVVERIEGCAICHFRNICGAPCPAELFSLGNMEQPSIFCEFYKEIIRYAFKIIAEGKEDYCFREEGLRNLEYTYRLGGIK